MGPRAAIVAWQEGVQHDWAQDLDHWAEWWSAKAPWLLVLVIGLLCARALLRRGRYRALRILGPAAQERVHEALRAAERATVGEIVPVVLERSDRFPGASWRSALVTLVVGTMALVGLLPWHDPLLVLACQLALAAAGYALAELLPDWKRLFVSEARAGEMAQEQALQEFLAHGLPDTEARTGVLILVSLFERRVVVLGDRGIAEKLGPDDWLEVDRAVLAGVRRGALAEGLVEGIALAGEKLARHFPWTEGERNELPDRLIVRRE